MELVTAGDGARVFVDRAAADRGSKAPFHVVYRSSAGEERWGWHCGHCESLETAMDTMGRIQCTECGNVRKPTEWDAAHE